MEKLELIDEFKVDPKFIEYIGNGKSGKVYRLTENHAGKFLYYPDFEELKHEYDICKLAYENGISVPKPEGVFEVRYPQENSNQLFSMMSPAFVMEYLSGGTILELFAREKEYKNYLYAKELFEKEREKAWKFGFSTCDVAEYNAIWNPKKEKVYLIDFEHWKIKK